MKVLKNNFDSSFSNVTIDARPYPRRLICEKCGSELEYSESDLRMGELGCNFVDCPLCNHDNMLCDNENNVTLTASNIEFPTHFMHTVVDGSSKVVDMCNTEEIRKCLDKAITYFAKYKDAPYWMTQYGNMNLVVYNLADESDYEIHVTKDYYTTYIPIE